MEKAKQCTINWCLIGDRSYSSGVGISGHLQSEGAKDMGSLVELEQVLLSLDSSGNTVSGMALWRQQLCAVAKVRFLKLKNERKSLMTM